MTSDQQIQAIRDALKQYKGDEAWYGCRVPNTDRICQSKTILPFDVPYIAACNPEAITALLARLDAAEADAARYRWVRHRVSGHGSHLDHQHFGFPTSLALRPVGDLMKGSVSQHLNDAIDAVRAKDGGT